MQITLLLRPVQYRNNMVIQTFSAPYIAELSLANVKTANELREVIAEFLAPYQNKHDAKLYIGGSGRKFAGFDAVKSEPRELHKVPDAAHPFEIMDDKGEKHGEFETLEEAHGCARFDRLTDYTVYQNGKIIETRYAVSVIEEEEEEEEEEEGEYCDECHETSPKGSTRCQSKQCQPDDTPSLEDAGKHLPDYSS